MKPLGERVRSPIPRGDAGRLGAARRSTRRPALTKRHARSLSARVAKAQIMRVASGPIASL